MFDLIPPFPPESLPSYRNIVAYPFNAKHMVLWGMFILAWASAISVETNRSRFYFITRYTFGFYFLDLVLDKFCDHQTEFKIRSELETIAKLRDVFVCTEPFPNLSIPSPSPSSGTIPTESGQCVKESVYTSFVSLETRRSPRVRRCKQRREVGKVLCRSNRVIAAELSIECWNRRRA